MRCPACGARNTEGAAWCTQCYAPLRGTPPASEVPADSNGPDDRPPPTPAEPRRAPGPVPAPDAAGRDVRTVDGEVEWRCGTCDGWSPLERDACATCGTPRRGFGEGTRPPPIPASDRGKLVAASILLPGLGHLLARRVGTGAVRLVLAGGWVVGALLILTGAGGAGRLPAVPLLIGAGVIWVASVLDVVALVDGGGELLRPRVLSFLTGGVLVAFVAVSIALAGGGGAVG